jgi:hypothetical protein
MLPAFCAALPKRRPDNAPPAYGWQRALVTRVPARYRPAKFFNRTSGRIGARKQRQKSRKS